MQVSELKLLSESSTQGFGGIMKKPLAISTVFLWISSWMLTVAAQTSTPTETPANWIVGVVTVAILVVFAVVIAYAAFKLIRKWSRE